MSRRLRVTGTLVITALCTAYIVWQIDITEAAHELAHANYAYFLAAVAIMLGSVVPMTWRWQRLLRARGMDESMGWLTRAYLVSYTVGQVLPTSLGGDASRIFETTRRHPATAGAAAGSVVLERALGGAATLVLAAVGFLLAVGHYDVGGYLWVELAFVLVTVGGGIAMFSKRARPVLRLGVPILRYLRLERPLRAGYEGLHSYRSHMPLLVSMFALTVVVQAVRILAIWLSGKAVGVDLSPRPYYVMGPLLFLVALVPFTINGLAVREAFFVSFLGQLGVNGSVAFDAGFLFFLVTIALSIPGLAIIGWEGLRHARPRAESSA
jgi:uncharacterized protein (TIRG00374 family)